jgi:Carboxypeptidase regulatory-like domain
MKKLFGSSFLCMRRMRNFRAMDREESAAPAAAGVIKLWRLSTFVLLGTMLLGFSAPVMGQAVNATLLGTVTDSSGAVVAGAKITITEMKTGVIHSATTNESGNYEVADLAPGQYEVAAEKQGFKKAVHTDVDVLVNTDTRINLVLDPGTAQETVVVSGEIPILQTDRADIGRKIEERQAEDLPLGFNRNFQGLLNLVPGTTRAHREHSSFFNAQDSLRTEVNGQSGLANNLEFEGLNDNERTGLLSIYIPPIEAIETVDVTTSNYDAELGRANGAVTNVILKSGTNTFHGAAYEINRISALAAVPFFQTAIAKAPAVYNYYGANIGGPIVKNKTFFFGDFLRINDHQGQFFNGTVPPTAFRNGDFSQAANSKGQLIPIYDPATGNPDGTGRTQFAFNGTPNAIDPTRISAIAQAILAKIPLPNVLPPGCSGNPSNPTGPGCLVATNNFQGTTKFIKDTTSFDVKMDHYISENNRLSGRFSYLNQSLSQAPIFGIVGGPSNGAFSGTGTQKYYAPAVNYYHVFSPTFLTEVRVGVDHYRNVANNTDRGQTVKSEIGVDIPGANLGDSNTSGMPCIVLTGNNGDNCLAGYSASLPWIRGETNLNVANNWTKTRGNHTFKWGVDYHRLRDDLAQWQDQNPRGVMRFTNNLTSLNAATQPVTSSQVNAVASFLLDLPNSVGRDVPLNAKAFRGNEFFTYAADRWEVSRKLTLDLGLRWEFYPPFTPRKAGRFSNYDPVANNLVIAGIGGNPSDLGRKTHYKDFAPRVGFAYRLTETTVVRGGFAISYFPYPDNDYAFDFPVLQNNAFPSLNGSSFTQSIDASNNPISMKSGFPTPLVANIPANGLIPVTPVKVGTTSLLTQNYTVVNLNFREPYTESWNLAVQHSLPGKFVLEAAYVGNHGVDLPTVYNLNAATLGSATATNNNRPLFARLSPSGVPYGLTGNVALKFLGTSSNYNALQAKLDRRFSGGFLMTTSYTFGKALGYVNEGSNTINSTVGGLQNYIGSIRSNYAPLAFDRRHTIVQSVIYELPFGKGKPLLKSGVGSIFLGGWQVSTILTVMTGLPLNITGGSPLNAPGDTQVPNLVGTFNILHGIGSPGPNVTPWFDVTPSNFITVNGQQVPQCRGAFCQTQGQGVLGNVARRVFSGPGFFNLDASVFRRFPITERMNMELRAEAFSVTNTPQFDKPNQGFSTSTASNFGYVTNTIGGNRSVEFEAKLTF